MRGPEPEPGSPAWHDEQRREAEHEKIRQMERRERFMDNNLAIAASVIAAGVSTRIEGKPDRIAAESVDIALEILKRVEDVVAAFREEIDQLREKAQR